MLFALTGVGRCWHTDLLLLLHQSGNINCPRELQQIQAQQLQVCSVFKILRFWCFLPVLFLVRFNCRLNINWISVKHQSLHRSGSLIFVFLFEKNTSLQSLRICNIYECTFAHSGAFYFSETPWFSLESIALLVFWLARSSFQSSDSWPTNRVCLSPMSLNQVCGLLVTKSKLDVWSAYAFRYNYLFGVKQERIKNLTYF